MISRTSRPWRLKCAVTCLVTKHSGHPAWGPFGGLGLLSGRSPEANLKPNDLAQDDIGRDPLTGVSIRRYAAYR
jgi:hypothetical protein